MNPAERHRLVLTLFDRACDLPHNERAPFLTAHCPDREIREEVKALLRKDESSDAFIDVSEPGRGLEMMAAEALCADDGEAPVPEIIGTYRIRRRIGHGGMGVIFEAVQDSPKRRVALKVLRPGLISRELLRRFQHEAHVLGQLQHPGIAQIHEAGWAELQHDRQPFFAMEYIDGEPIDKFVDRHALGVNETLELVARVCDAVQHAHQKGVIHRDIKPSNVLVQTPDDGTRTNAADTHSTGSGRSDGIGQPKVLDFGIARVTDADLQTVTVQTEVGQLVGTLAYMSPEQARGNPTEVDTRCDVYALGVMLYELLSGKRPLDLTGLAMAEAARVIGEDEPTPLGQVDRNLRGDIATIVAKAMDKDRERRYATAAEFAADIRRYRNHQPIDARPASTFYQINKFAARNKGLVFGLAAAFVMLIIALIGTSYGLIESNRARGEAEKEKNTAIAARKAADAARAAADESRDDADQAARFQATQLEGVDVPRMGANLKAAILDAVPQEKRRQLAERLSQINFTDVALGVIEKDILEPSIQAIDEEFSDQPQLQTRLLATAATTLQTFGLFERAEEPFRRSLEIRRSTLGEEHIDTLRAGAALGGLFVAMGKLDEAEATLRDVLDTATRVLGPEHPGVLSWSNSLAALLFKERRIDEAISLFRKTLEIQKRTLDSDDEDLLANIGNLGIALLQKGDLKAAKPILVENYEARRRVLGEDHPNTLVAMDYVAAMFRAEGDLEEAESLYRRALESARRLRGSKHPKTISCMNNLAGVLYRMERFDEAEPLFRASLELTKEVFGAEHAETITYLENLGALLRKTNRGEESKTLYLEALSIRRRGRGDLDSDTLRAIYHVAKLHASYGERDEAIKYYKEAVAGARQIFGEHHPKTITATRELAKNLELQGKRKEAEPFRRAVLKAMRQLKQKDGINSVRAMDDLGINLNRQGRGAEAEPLLRESLRIRETLTPGAWQILATQSELGEAIAADSRRYAEAEELMVKAIENLQHHPFAESERGTQLLQTMNDRIIRCYESWHKSDPSAGFDKKLRAWQERS